MKKSNDIATQEFVDGIKLQDYDKYQILLRIREIVFDNYPQVKERIMYGWIMFSDPDDMGGVFVYQNHISFEFSNGYKFNDPDKQLEGKGQYRRHVKHRSMDDLENKKFDFFMKQIKDKELWNIHD